MISLRNYQNNGVEGIRECFRRLIKFVLFVLPTGGGKTVVFTYLAQRMSLKEKKVIILVHRVELLRQTSAALSKFDVEHGMINPQYTPNFLHKVQVASVQTIIRRLNYFAASNWIPDVIIIDEAHHANSKSWKTIVDTFITLNPDLKVIGVTATPIRGDGQGLGIEAGGMFQEMVLGPQLSYLIEEGFLVRPKIFGPPEKLDLSGVHSAKGDYNKDDLINLVDKPRIIGDAVSHYAQLCPGVPTIVFCVSVAHAEHVAKQFQDGGYRFYSIDGSMDDDTRKNLIDGLTSGTVQGLTTCDLISEGTDIPRATCAIELRPTKSKGLNFQQKGRVLRPVYEPGYDLNTKEGRLLAIANSEKPFAWILDHVGNTDEHGLPYEDQDWNLDGETKKSRGKKQEATIRVQTCLSCFACHEPAPVCPECGHIYETRDNTPKQIDGQLREITEETIRKKNARKEVGKSSSLEELLRIGAERGYKENWAHIQFSLKEQKRQAQLERMQAKIDLHKSTEIEFAEFEEITVSEEEFESWTKKEFEGDFNF